VSWHEGWKAITTHPSMSGWGNFDDDVWELYHTDADRSELHDLAAEQPVRLRELVNLWYAEAGANGAFPLDDRSGLEIFATPRPRLSKPRNRYLYYPDVADVPESQAVNIRRCRCGVQVPRNRPGVPEARPPMDWAQLRRQALTFTRATGGSSGAREKTS
jgi:hypothetical protein